MVTVKTTWKIRKKAGQAPSRCVIRHCASPECRYFAYANVVFPGLTAFPNKFYAALVPVVQHVAHPPHPHRP